MEYIKHKEKEQLVKLSKTCLKTIMQRKKGEKEIREGKEYFY